MAKKISALPAASTLDGTEIVPIVQSSTTVKATLSAVVALAGSVTSGSNLGAGAQVFKDVTAGTIRHRTLLGTGSTSTSVTQGTNDVTLRTLPPGAVNPCDYGAIANLSYIWDNVQDDTAAIQAALDAAPQGGVVQLPPGNYFISAPLVTQLRSTHLRGTGMPSFSNQSTAIHATAPMDCMLRVNGQTTVEHIYLDCASNAKHGIERNGESQSTYRNITVLNALFDGIHSLRFKPVWAFTAVTQTGSGPDITVAPYPGPLFGGDYRINILSTGALGAGTFEVALSIPAGSATLGPYTLPANGTFGIPKGTLEASLGMLVTFPAGTYNMGDFYTWTVTGLDDISTVNGNDQSRFIDCIVTASGNVYATAGFRGGIRALSEFTNRSLHNTEVLGTVDITASSQFVIGTGTSFIATNARPGDYIRIGAFPDWEANTVYAPGDKVVAAGAVPGQCFVWICTDGGTSDGTQPRWIDGVTPGNMPTAGGGVEVTDNDVTWQCWNPCVFQILNVQDDGTICINENGGPINSDTGLDFAICVGSGYYEESASDGNTNTIDGGVYNSNAACGVMSTSSYTDGIIRGQATDNGVCGYSFGLHNDTSIDHVIVGTYSEGNLCSHVILAYADGIDIVHPVFSTDCMNIYQLRPNAYGAWRGTNTIGGLVDQPLGASAYSTIPVVSTNSGTLFRVQGPISLAEGTAASITGASYQFTPDGAVIRASADGDYTLTSNPTISNGLHFGQVLRIFNYGANPITFDGSLGLSLDQPFVTLLPTTEISFFWDGTAWRQQHPVGRGTLGPAVAIPSTDIDWTRGAIFTLTLAAGANSLTFSNATSGMVITVRLTGAASTVSWPTVKWAGGTPPTQTASGTDVYTFVHDGTDIYGTVVQDLS